MTLRILGTGLVVLMLVLAGGCHSNESRYGVAYAQPGCAVASPGCNPCNTCPAPAPVAVVPAPVVGR